MARLEFLVLIAVRKCQNAARCASPRWIAWAVWLLLRHAGVSPITHRIACNPLSAMMLSSLSAGPAGWVSPCSHLRTVEAVV